MRKCSSLAHPRLRVWLRPWEYLSHFFEFGDFAIPYAIFSQPQTTVQTTGAPAQSSAAVNQASTLPTQPQPMQPQPTQTMQPQPGGVTQVAPSTPPSTVLSLADVFVPLESIQPGKSVFREVHGMIKPRNLKGGIGSLFDPCVNAIGQRLY